MKIEVLGYKGLTAFFYEEPERFEHLTVRVLRAARVSEEEGVVACLQVLKEEGCVTDKKIALRVVQDMLKSPPPIFDVEMAEEEFLDLAFGEEM